jgi:hypothetical protein
MRIDGLAIAGSGRCEAFAGRVAMSIEQHQRRTASWKRRGNEKPWAAAAGIGCAGCLAQLGSRLQYEPSPIAQVPR